MSAEMDSANSVNIAYVWLRRTCCVSAAASSPQRQPIPPERPYATDDDDFDGSLSARRIKGDPLNNLKR
jgi:hypothetical protein